MVSRPLRSHNYVILGGGALCGSSAYDQETIQAQSSFLPHTLAIGGKVLIRFLFAEFDGHLFRRFEAFQNRN